MNEIARMTERLGKKRERNSFLTPLVVEVMESGKRFRLYNEFTYRLQRLGTGKGFTINVPAGFETDFASIPRIFRIIIPKLGRYNKAAVLHDAIYQGQHQLKTSLGCPMRFTRKQADTIFLDGMKELGVAKWKRRLMYWAVRIGGRWAWRNR